MYSFFFVFIILFLFRPVRYDMIFKYLSVRVKGYQFERPLLSDNLISFRYYATKGFNLYHTIAIHYSNIGSGSTKYMCIRNKMHMDLGIECLYIHYSSIVLAYTINRAVFEQNNNKTTYFVLFFIIIKISCQTNWPFK